MWDCEQLIGLTVSAVDGELGQLTDLCFDDERWVIRYFVVDSGASDGQVLIAPGIDELADDIANAAPMADVRTTGDEGLDWDMVMADADTLVGPATLRGTCDRTEPAAAPGQELATGFDVHLQRVAEVRGYRVVASDGEVGRVEGFLISESSWAIEYVIVQTGAGHAARKVVLLPSWIRGIDRADGRVSLAVPRHVVLAGPEFTEDIGAAYESWLLTHLGRLVLPQAH
jgi:hypothetical protein